jgi:hypothetical protein
MKDERRTVCAVTPAWCYLIHKMPRQRTRNALIAAWYVAEAVSQSDDQRIRLPGKLWLDSFSLKKMKAVCQAHHDRACAP